MNTIPIETLRRWADQVAFAVDNPDEAIDALFELSASLEDALEEAIAGEAGGWRDWCKACGTHRGLHIELVA